jgi:hypothetical protein
VHKIKPFILGNRKVSQESLILFSSAEIKPVLLNEKSEILWQTRGYGRDGFVLENGNILVSVANVAKEISRDGKLVWSYQLSKGK